MSCNGLSYMKQSTQSNSDSKNSKRILGKTLPKSIILIKLLDYKKKLC